jgi:hypothetical protein
LLSLRDEITVSCECCRADSDSRDDSAAFLECEESGDFDTFFLWLLLFRGFSEISAFAFGLRSVGVAVATGEAILRDGEAVDRLFSDSLTSLLRPAVSVSVLSRKRTDDRKIFLNDFIDSVVKMILTTQDPDSNLDLSSATKTARQETNLLQSQLQSLSSL